MSLWDVAGAAIAAAFADPEPIIYTQGATVLPPITAVRSDRAAPSFDGRSGTLRTIAYEVPFAALPASPTKKDHFTHRGRKWRIEAVERLDEVAAWDLTVGDDGPAA